MQVRFNNELVASDYTDLTLGKTYRLLGIAGTDDYRIMSDRGKPYLYPAELFDVVDARRPADWVSELGELGDEYAGPAAFSKPGFWEDYFDDDADAIQTVRERLGK